MANIFIKGRTMKKLIIFLLLGVALLFLCGCEEVHSRSSVTIGVGYYPHYPVMYSYPPVAYHSWSYHPIVVYRPPVVVYGPVKGRGGGHSNRNMRGRWGKGHR